MVCKIGPCHTQPRSCFMAEFLCVLSPQSRIYWSSRYSPHRSWRSHSCCLLLIPTVIMVLYMELNVSFCTSAHNFCCEKMLSKWKESSGTVSLTQGSEALYLSCTSIKYFILCSVISCTQTGKGRDGQEGIQDVDLPIMKADSKKKQSNLMCIKGTSCRPHNSVNHNGCEISNCFLSFLIFYPWNWAAQNP